MLRPSTFSVASVFVVVALLNGAAHSAPLANLVLVCPDENVIGQDFESCRGYTYEIPTTQRIVFSPATYWSRASDLTASDLVTVCTVLVEPGAYSHCRDAAGVRRTAYVAKGFVLGGPVLYFTNVSLRDGGIERITSDGAVREILHDVGDGLRGIAVDEGSNSLFWTDVDTDRIESTDLYGSSGEPFGVITAGVEFPFGIDVSRSARRLFWADQSLEHVESSNLDGTERQVLFSAFTGSVAVDDVNGKVYSENRSKIPEEAGRLTSIVRSNFDGTGFETVINNVPTVFNLAIDPLHEVIYWTSSAGLTNGNGGVYRVDFDGTGFAEIFVMGSNLDTGGIALDFANGKVYWGQSASTDLEDIYRMNLDGSDPEVVATGFDGVTDISLVSLVSEQSIPVTIDIKPRDEHHVIDSRARDGVLVAVLSDTGNETAFDALQIDPATVQIGPKGGKPNRYRARDVNGDGVADLLMRFWIPDTGIKCGNTVATLTGETFDGRNVSGSDSIRTVGCDGN
jgi:hypothetical protein